MTTPSYWAGRVTGIAPEAQYTQALQSIRQARQAALQKLEEKIRETENLIRKERTEKSAVVPLR